MTSTSGILEEAEVFAAGLLRSLPEQFVYHNYSHTLEVVKAVKKIGIQAGLSDEEQEIGLLAAWFHDTGFVRTMQNHEAESMELAAGFLREKSYPKQQTQLVLGCIEATHRRIPPRNAIEAVVCDADFIHLTKASYFDRLRLLRKEIENLQNQTFSDEEWYEQNLEFLRSQLFFTEYGKLVLQPKLDENIQAQLKLLKKLRRIETEALTRDIGLNEEKIKELKKKLRNMEGRSERGVETMFRLTSRNHIRLSSMADTKANILISVNAIIISVLIGGLVKALDNNPHLVFPTYLLLAVNVITIIFAILSTRPMVTKGKFTRKDIEEKKTNLLFFGNFHQMEQQDYKWGMLEMLNDADYLYSSLIDDIYFLGKVLGRKYRFLRISYNIFMFGIILAVIVFVIANMNYLATL
jgi:predicted metal-dependent HD superfamily phosphohydrolase